MSTTWQVSVVLPLGEVHGGRVPELDVAVDDPARRPDLVRLLERLPEASGPAQMSPARLRAALGL